MEEGYEVGDVCNREGCDGVIKIDDTLDGGCSCHINPPCSWCETPKEVCPKCTWSAKEEKQESDYKYYNSPEYKERLAKLQEFYRLEGEKYKEGLEKFWENYKDHSYFPDEIDYIKQSHSNSSMKISGMYPKEMSSRELGEYLKKNHGTFGGRYEVLDVKKNRFVYIAYTD